MSNLPLHFFLVDLIEACQDLPDIISDNARCKGMPEVDSEGMDASDHSTSSSCSSSMGGSSRWESISKKDKAPGCLRRPSRELDTPTTVPSISAQPAADSTSTHPSQATFKQDRAMKSTGGMKQPTRTHSFDDITVFKDSNFRRGGPRPTPGSIQNRKKYLVPTSPTGTTTAVNMQTILSQAMVELQASSSL